MLRSAAVLAVGLTAGLAAAQEPSTPAAHGASERRPAHEGHAEEHEHANELAVFLGGTTENDETHFTIGGEYERRLGERFGLSFVGEHVNDTAAWVFVAPFTFRPVRRLGLKLYAGPGFETKVPEREPHVTEGSPSDADEHDRATFFVARAGVGWALELGRVALTPQLELDSVREDGRWEKALVFGIAIGMGF
jgi:hypothetical protein